MLIIIIQVGRWNNTNGTGQLMMDPDAPVLFPGKTTAIPSDTAQDLSNITLRIVTILVSHRNSTCLLYRQYIYCAFIVSVSLPALRNLMKMHA